MRLCVCVFEGEREKKVQCAFVRACVCVSVCMCALMCALSKYPGGFSCQGENEYWNDYQLINDPV